MMNRKFYNFEKVDDNSANLYIYGDIVSMQDWFWGSDDDITPNQFKDDLNELGNIKEINVHINSYGGEVFAGFAIYNMLKQHSAKINTYIDGIAASAASIIAMAGDTIYMPKTSLMMIHNTWSYVKGNAVELRKQAEDMDKINTAIRAAYLEKIKINEDELKQLLDEETLMTAEECIEKGFADKLVEEVDYAQNIYSNKTLMSIYNKTKYPSKIQNSKIEISNEVIEKIANKVVELTQKQKILEKKKDLKENKNSWESFFGVKK